uniref:Apoptosis facilitator Bcl-2-like protein 14 n=1 Tax=Callorhinchus milii TaxID=7868 RepID=A0A4W3HYF4_CALMI
MGSLDESENEIMLDSSPTDMDSVEFKILMAYAKRTLPLDKVSQLNAADKEIVLNGAFGETEEMVNDSGKREKNGKDKTRSENHARKSKRKKKSGWRRCIPQCLRAEANEYASPVAQVQEESGGDAMPLSSYPDIIYERPQEHEVEPQFNEIAEVLQEIIDSKLTGFKFRLLRSTSLEVDSEDEEQRAVDQIVKILTTSGDNLNEEMKNDPQFSKIFGKIPSISLFKKVMDCVIQVALPEETSSEAASKENGKLNQIAFVMHATTKFAALGNHPMARVMGFGAKYLQENYCTWITEQGGWVRLEESITHSS